MKNYLLLLTITTFSLATTAQVAVIQDKDGYTNVRKEPNTKAEILKKINEAEVFFTGDEKEGWTTVHLPFDSFSEDNIRRGTMRGYVHSSRILPLEKIEEYEGDDVEFSYEIIPFSKEGKTIQYEGDDERFVSYIDYDPFWGTDGEIPKTEVKALTISVNGKKVEVPEKLIKDIYEVTSDFDVYKINDTFIVHQSNSDGAGYYELCWVFDKDGVKQRLVGNPD